MKYTNRLDLPEALVNAIINDDYDKGDANISATGLLLPPRIALLRQQHAEELEEDIADNIYSLIGKIAHGILEKSPTNSVVEKRLYMESLGWKVSGKFDDFTFNGQRLTDYKLTTLFKFKDGKVPLDFEQQQNIYVELFANNGVTVKESYICAILKDWSKPEARRNRDLPQQGVLNLPVRIWPQKDRRAFIDWRVSLHQAAIKEGVASICTDEERWHKPPKYAAIKKGAKRASKLFDTIQEAKVFAQENNLEVEKRDGQDMRCENYCNVARHCDYWKQNVDPSRLLRNLHD